MQVLLQGGQDVVHHVLIICGFDDPAQRLSLIAEGFNEVSDFGIMSSQDDIAEMASKISKLPVN
jgi:hypothetical protein